MKKPSKIDLLELDIDIRMRELWSNAELVDDWTMDVVAAFMRAAYGKGYCDALTDEDPDQIFTEHGYAAPRRRGSRQS